MQNRDGQFVLYRYDGWFYYRIGKRVFKTLWGAAKRASRASRLFRCVVVTTQVDDNCDGRIREK